MEKITKSPVELAKERAQALNKNKPTGPTTAVGPAPMKRPQVIGQAKLTDEQVAEIFKSLSGNYERKKGKNANIFLAGDSGSGKTHLLKTMPGPIHIDSCDPDGLETLSEEIKSGLVIPDTRWELDNPKAPSMFKLWDEVFLQRLQSGYFNHIGTYVLDSLTTWADLLMNNIINEEKRPNTAPQIQDYGLQQVLAKTAVKMIAGLPCNCVITAHLDTMKDDVSGKVMTSIMVPGKASVKLPLEFSELYVLEAVSSISPQGEKTSRTLLTRNTGKYRAKTRMGKNGLFDLREPADLGALMRKAGLPTDNKPLMPGQ